MERLSKKAEVRQQLVELSHHVIQGVLDDGVGYNELQYRFQDYMRVAFRKKTKLIRSERPVMTVSRLTSEKRHTDASQMTPRHARGAS